MNSLHTIQGFNSYGESYGFGHEKILGSYIKKKRKKLKTALEMELGYSNAMFSMLIVITCDNFFMSEKPVENVDNHGI